VRELVRAFVTAGVPHGADGQIDRAAHRFGLVAAAGELATLFGLTPWREGEATEAAAWALTQWIDGRGGTEPAETSRYRPKPLCSADLFSQGIVFLGPRHLKPPQSAKSG